jgi:hypothetical protein
MRVERIVLKHHGDIALRRLHAVDALVADIEIAGRDRLQSCNDPEQGRLAAAGGTDEDNKFVVRDLQIEIGDHGEVAVLLDEIANRNRGHDR